MYIQKFIRFKDDRKKCLELTAAGWNKRNDHKQIPMEDEPVKCMTCSGLEEREDCEP
jgi:DNA-binding MarR family transcriptional regulator